MAWFIVAGFAIVGLAHVAPFPFLLERFAPRESLWRVPPTAGGTPTVYLTFDDGPNPEATPQLLDALHETGGRATFFLIYDHLSADTAPIVQRMFADGHAVGLHSDTRAMMVQTPAVLAAILQEHAARIELMAGRPPCRLFRPHAGWRSGAMLEALRSIDHRLVGWSFGLWDFNWYRRPDPAALATSSSCTTVTTRTRAPIELTRSRPYGGWYRHCAPAASSWARSADARPKRQA
jgi:peptidoglycan/xylan/chitin deacetylase (PgdA/CDA1 family)